MGNPVATIRISLIALVMGVCGCLIPLPTVASTSTDFARIPLNFSYRSPPIADLPFVFFKDTGGSVTIAKVLAWGDPFKASRWIRASAKRQPERYSESWYWLATKVKNLSSSPQSLIFDYHHPRERYLDVYIQRANGDLETYHTGDMRPFDQRPIRYQNFAFPIQINANETIILYIHAKNRPRYIVTRSRILHPVTFFEKASAVVAVQQLYMGALAAIALFNLVLAVFLRERVYVYFLLVVLSTGYGMVVYFGLDSALLWPNLPFLSTYAGALAGVAFSLSTLLFVDEFGQLRQAAPKARWSLYGISGLTVILLGVSIFPVDKLPIVTCIIALIVIQALFILVVSVWLAIRGNTAARWLATAWSIGIAGIVVWLLLRLEQTEQNFHAYFLGQLGQVIVLSIAVFWRISDMRAREQQARSESYTKSNFLAQMSHEIRNPMNGVIGMTQLLQETSLDKTQRRYTRIIQNSATALLTILNDILDISKIDAGKLRIVDIAFDLQRLVDECLQMFSLQAKEKGLSLHCYLASDVPRYIRSDPNRIRQILINFLSNACKFTDYGSVGIHISCYSPDPLLLKLSVKDTGIGIRPDLQQKLFERFEQADDFTTRKYGGTGLGLAICKQLSELMGGEIGMESRPGSGSTFWVTFAVSAAEIDDIEDHQLRPRQLEDSKALTILVVEDGEVNRMVAQRFLEKMGHKCVLAENGEQAISGFESSLRGEEPPIDMVLMDVEMPVMDGLEATRRLRELERRYGVARIPVIAMTAHMLPEHIEQCEAAGMNEHLSKPLQYPVVQSTIGKYVGYNGG